MERRIRFSSYELDPEAGELRKAGVRVPLSGQPLDVLALLAGRPGEVVTREELKEALWPDGTFVDFDDGVNTAIRRIRRALDDSATQPRFIETLPRRGYRFVGEVSGERATDVRSTTDTTSLGLVYRAVALISALAVGGYWFWVMWEEGSPSVFGPPRSLTALPGIERDPTFSPDGSQFAFAWDGGGEDFDIYVRAVNGGSPVNITEHFSGDDIAPAWSPDGEWIAFWRQDEHQSGVFLVSPLGGRERRLSRVYPEIDERGRHVWTSIQLSWSQDGLLAFSTHTLRSSDSAMGRVSAGITVIRPEGDERLITHGEDYHPAFSPDGGRVGFIRGGRVFAVDPAVGEASLEGPWGQRLNRYSTGLRWLANGEQLLLSAVSHGIEVRKASGSGSPDRVAAGLTLQPAVSKDGRLAAFARRTLDYNIWRIDLKDGRAKAGSRAHKIFASTRSEIAPRLSWDGERILFQSSRNRGSTHAYIAEMTGRNLVEHQKAERGGIAGFGGSPRWSPDARWIAFDTDLQLAVNSSNGGTARLLTSGRGSGHTASWSEDGRWIYYLTGEINPVPARGRLEIWRIPFDDGEAGEPELVVEKGGPPNLVGEDLYFLRSLPDSSSDRLAVWRATPGGAEEAVPIGSAVIDSATRCWAVSDRAIFFVESEEGERSGEWWVKRLEPSTGETKNVVEMHRPPGYVNCLEVARDESFLLYVADDSDEQDLMIMEGFAR